MKIPVIKKLVEEHSAEALEKAEAALAEEQTPEIEIPGDDEGEQLTHAFAALWIKQKMDEGEEFKTALRAYTQMVRSSIS
ncbi:DUF6952 family protein [Flexithrix dorotheae]|uniref:DUF6952 family protein n=1 Tax=Flexithrix dorotheae TaxID=70993 RepID=UPI000370614C|nr:hypothetical protein [Flexithrix dorotheae]